MVWDSNDHARDSNDISGGRRDEQRQTLSDSFN